MFARKGEFSHWTIKKPDRIQKLTEIARTYVFLVCSTPNQVLRLFLCQPISEEEKNGTKDIHNDSRIIGVTLLIFVQSEP